MRNSSYVCYYSFCTSQKYIFHIGCYQESKPRLLRHTTCTLMSLLWLLRHWNEAYSARLTHFTHSCTTNYTNCCIIFSSIQSVYYLWSIITSYNFYSIKPQPEFQPVQGPFGLDKKVYDLVNPHHRLMSVRISISLEIPSSDAYRFSNIGLRRVLNLPFAVFKLFHDNIFLYSRF